jgi:hypothetical protein
VSPVEPGRVLRLAILGWGLGHLAMGRTATGVAWLLAEAGGLAVLIVLTFLFGDTTWYLVPFLAGMAFIAVWTLQAVLAYRTARHLPGAVVPTDGRSPASAAAWLTLPLLVWGTGFWLIGAGAATPGAVLDRFVSGWTDVDGPGWSDAVTDDPARLGAAARDAVERLEELCADGRLAEDCADSQADLLREVRIRIVGGSNDSATAVAEAVRFELRPARLFGIFETRALTPVAIDAILRLDLAARPAAAGSARWTIVNAERG